jgi:hypothetical protein
MLASGRPDERLFAARVAQDSSDLDQCRANVIAYMCILHFLT